MPIEPRSLKELFLAALALAPAERAAWLERECAQDAQLRQRVELMLVAHETPQSLLDRVAPPAPPPEPATGALAHAEAERASPAEPEEPGTVLAGKYKLLEQIGEGGMGTVWMAQQQEPVKRLVAVKLIKPGMDSKQVLARFGAERQALALMDHPHIAKVHDAGTAPDGRPFFVMELVKGVPITGYCDEHRLTPRQRLELFVPVCQAIQHAHHKGIIHRDLKPSNVLVARYDDRPVPKVIDFGVAKATGTPLTEETLHTGFGAIIGTVEYMSPEQATFNQLDVDTRSDIYALGVLLYELLAGSPPFTRKELEKAGVLEMLRLIREQEPPKPSTRLSTADGLPALAANRGTEPKRLTALVRGELDWIVMKALEKDRSRRYETANGFAMDVQRYLADEPVQACPPSAWYRLRKFVRRNKGALVMAACGLVSVLALVGSIGWAVRDRAARGHDAARERAARQTRLEEDVTRAVAETETFSRLSKLTEARAAAKQAERLLASGELPEELVRRVRQWRTDVEMAARLEEIGLSQTLNWDGDVDLAKFFFHRRDQAYREAFREYGLDIEGPEPEKTAARIRASAIKESLLIGLGDWLLGRWPLDHASAKRLLAVVRKADTDPWRARLCAAIENQDRKVLKEMAQDPSSADLSPSTAVFLGKMLGKLGEETLAEELWKRVVRRHPDDCLLNWSIGWALSGLTTTRAQEAEGFYRAALALRPRNGNMRFFFAIFLSKQGRLAEAEAETQEALRLAPQSWVLHSSLGSYAMKQGNLPQAESHFREAIRLSPEERFSHHFLAVALARQGKWAQAETAARQAVRLWPDRAEPRSDLGAALAGQGRLDEAMAEYREALRREPDHAETHRRLGAILSDHKHDYPGAVAAFRESLRHRPDHAKTYFNLGLTLGRQRKFVEAEVALRKAIRCDPKLLRAHLMLGLALAEQGKLDEAIAAFRQETCLDPANAGAHAILGGILARQNKPAEAEVALREAIRLAPADAETHQNLGAVLSFQDKLPEAVAAFRQALKINPNQANAKKNLPRVLVKLGNALRQKGDREGAIAAYRQALEVWPGFAEAQVNLNAIREEKGDPDGKRQKNAPKQGNK